LLALDMAPVLLLLLLFADWLHVLVVGMSRLLLLPFFNVCYLSALAWLDSWFQTSNSTYIQQYYLNCDEQGCLYIVSLNSAGGTDRFGLDFYNQYRS
jgi:hypothetical protein